MISNQELKSLYNELNETKFGNELPKRIRVRWDLRRKEKATAREYTKFIKGKLKHKYTIQFGSAFLVLSKEKLTPYMIHEMLHIRDYTQNNYKHHGDGFRGDNKRLGGNQ